MIKARFQNILQSDSVCEVYYMKCPQAEVKTWKIGERSFGIQIIEAYS